MSPLSNLPSAILDTVLGRLAVLFLTGASGHLETARDAARQMLAAYHPTAPDELHLAAEIISFSAHALEALGQAANPDLSLNQKLRLRGSAVSLSRESHKSQRKLDQLQKARRTGAPAHQAETPNPPSEPVPTPIRPRIDNALALIAANREAPATISPNQGQTWTQAYQQRQAAKRIAHNLKKNQTQHLAATAIPQTAVVANS